jgi:uncharacterized surface protein with fasciclin (FAS1) repeats
MEYPDEGDWVIPGLAQSISMYDGDEVTGTYEFYKFIYASQVDTGVCFDRYMSTLMTFDPPGMPNGKWTAFVLVSDKVNDIASSDYFGEDDFEDIEDSDTENRKLAFKLLQYYIVVGEHRLADLSSSITMDNGVELSVSGNTITGVDGNTVNIISGDHEARNGVFHIIDGPLHPTDVADYQYIYKSYLYDYAGGWVDKEEVNPY